MYVFTCLEVAWLAPNYCLGADSDEMWYVATPNTVGILSLTISMKEPSCSCSVISPKAGLELLTFTSCVWFLSYHKLHVFVSYIFVHGCV